MRFTKGIHNILVEQGFASAMLFMCFFREQADKLTWQMTVLIYIYLIGLNKGKGGLRFMDMLQARTHE